ncbi:MAG: histidine kinase [Alistipes sp.]|nr:histidine kinase [Alistipes sp.]MDE7129286.1 histidine kinase [Alistipes sp.]
MINYSHNERVKSGMDNKSIIFIFAVLHAAVAIISRMMDYYDDVPLTVLTITMVIVVAMRQNVRMEMIAVITLVATLLGFVIGELLWKPIDAVVDNEVLSPAISTFVITMLIGWGTYALTRNGSRFKNYNAAWRPSVFNILAIALSILLLRVVYVIMFRTEFFTDTMMLDTVQRILGNVVALLILTCGNILLTVKSYSHFTRKPRSMRGRRHGIVLISIIAVIPILASLAVYYDVPLMVNPEHCPVQLARIFAVAFLIHIIIYTLSYLIQHTLASKRELRSEREQKHKALYQYNRLKQQINPHFLFNSLNILDYLVQEGHSERASGFIRKLANIYRYMLNNDQKPLVKLKEELDFADMYVDLLKERFVDGLTIEKQIDPALYNMYIVPCSLQLLIENATKHNIVCADEPLHVEIFSQERHIVVRNNLQPRITGQQSTHLGLANIRQQYLDITRNTIIIEKTESEFIVKLPLV